MSDGCYYTCGYDSAANLLASFYLMNFPNLPRLQGGRNISITYMKYVELFRNKQSTLTYDSILIFIAIVT